MGGYSVQCDCGKWFMTYEGYKDHCRALGHIWDQHRVGPRSLKDNQRGEHRCNLCGGSMKNSWNI